MGGTPCLLRMFKEMMLRLWIVWTFYFALSDKSVSTSRGCGLAHHGCWEVGSLMLCRSGASRSLSWPASHWATGVERAGMGSAPQHRLSPVPSCPGETESELPKAGP